MIDGKITVTLSIAEANYYNALEERDKAKPIKLKTYDFKLSDGSYPTPSELCPNCEASVQYEKGTFCPMCGQRLDRENTKL